jgi:surfeit locus 1 family protein
MKGSARDTVAAVAALAGIAMTVSLGVWQLHRGQQKDELQHAIDAKSREPAIDARELLGSPETAAIMHRRVRLTGRWDSAHTVFLDNRQMDGRVGFYVVTPLVIGREAAVAVQRGWAPRDFEQRARLPHVDTPQGDVTVEGLLAPPPAKLYDLGEARGGTIRQNLDLDAYRIETKLPLATRLSVQQTGAPSEGLVRDWPPAAATAARNYGYAFQWWALAGLIAFLYVRFQIVLPRRRVRRV